MTTLVGYVCSCIKYRIYFIPRIWGLDIARTILKSLYVEPWSVREHDFTLIIVKSLLLKIWEEGEVRLFFELRYKRPKSPFRIRNRNKDFPSALTGHQQQQNTALDF